MTFFFALLGAILASFALCFTWRQAHNLSQKGRSTCNYCGHPLRWYELIPIFSYLFQKGHCRYCHKKLPWSLLFFESLAFCFFALAYLKLNNQLPLLLWQGAFLTLLLFIAAWDLHTQELADSYQVIFFAFSLIHYSQGWGDSLGSRILASLFLGLPLFLLHCYKPQGLGGADVLFAFNIGFLLGLSQASYAFLLGILSALIYALYLIVFKKATGKTSLPLLPFLCFGLALILSM